MSDGPDRRIPVFEPTLREDDLLSAIGALRAGEISGSFGSSIPTFERELARVVGVRHGVACTSGTTALHLAVAAAGIGRGDKVLVSASTNIATALAIEHNGAIPVPVDSEDVTWNLDLGLLPELIDGRVRALIPVHLYGHPADMDALMAFANDRGLVVIEDCAEAHGALVRGRPAGSFGQMSCYSFYANKIITTGEGGMVLTDDDSLAERLRLLRNLAFTKPRFRHEELGFNFRLTGVQAALGIPQVRRLEEIVATKRRIATMYREALEDISGLRLPAEMPWARNVYWMYAVEVLPELGLTRDELARRLDARGVETRTFFCPLNLQPCLARHPEVATARCPVAERLWRTGLYLPSSHSLAAEDVGYVADAIREAASS